MDDDRNTLVRPDYIAKQLGCSVSTLNRMVKVGRFPEPIRFVEHGFPRWPKAALLDWLEAARRRCAEQVNTEPTPAAKPRGRPPGSGWRGPRS
jgi:predicted DNA-binding transcriptional regulator AlpA